MISLISLLQPLAAQKEVSLSLTLVFLWVSLDQKIQDFLPLLNKCEKRLIGLSPFLNQAGRLQMTNAVFSSLPTFSMCTLALPKTVIKQLDKYRKHCVWRGSDIHDKKPPKAAWKLVCKPKPEGGLGVIDIEQQNKALLLKHFHKFFNKVDLPWVHIVWG